jgi:hypothetical protein
MTRTEIARHAFCGTYPALVAAYKAAQAHTCDGQAYPAEIVDLHQLTAWVETLDPARLATLTGPAADQRATQPSLSAALRARAATAWAAEQSRRVVAVVAEEAARAAEEQAAYEADAATLAEQVAQYELSAPDGAPLYTSADLRGGIARHPASLYAGAMLRVDGLVFGYTYYAGLHLLAPCPACGAWGTSRARLTPGDLAQLGALQESPAWVPHACPSEDGCPF